MIKTVACFLSNYHSFKAMLEVVITSSSRSAVCRTGQFLVERIQKEGLEVGLGLAFVWNRNADKLSGSVPNDLVLTELSDFTHKYARASFMNKYTPSCFQTAS